MLLNLQRGHQFLSEHFAYHPRVAWSLDDAGHSSANARILSESGIEAVFILSIDPEERRERLMWGEMEFVWRPFYAHLGRKTEMMGHIIYDFNTSPMDLLVMDSKDDPSDGHIKPNKTDPNLHPNETDHPP